jgi:CrcB protein
MTESFREMALLGAGGAAGTICRYGANALAFRTLGARFAFGTLAVNVLGCFVMGLVMHWLDASASSSRALRLALTTGFLGGFTTFSAFGYETVRFLEVGKPTLAIANVAANVVLGIAATYAGLSLARSAF